nr:transmembrane protein 231-like isoform X2 [Dermacentor andersoni]
MAVYTLFCEGVHRKYKASLCSKATAFVVVLSCATIVIPFMFAYKDLGFWKKLDQYQEQPEVRFKRRLIFILECGEGLVFWSSYPFLNSHATELSIPSVEDLEEDFDSDGKMDELNLSVKMPLPKKFDVLRVKILLLFDCRIATYTRVSYEGLAFIDHSSSISGSELSLTGELRLRQKELLRPGSHDSRFEHSIINLDSSSVSSFSLDFILDEYSKRNVTTQLSNVQSTWRVASGATHFLANLRIKYPVEILWYRPGVWQVLKHAWTQYLAFLAIFLLLGERTKEFVFVSGGEPEMLHRKQECHSMLMPLKKAILSIVGKDFTDCQQWISNVFNVPYNTVSPIGCQSWQTPDSKNLDHIVKASDSQDWFKTTLCACIPTSMCL